MSFTVRRFLLTILLAACARPPLEPFHDESAELVTIAAVSGGNSMWEVLGEPIARGRRYAVVDDRGYFGTLRAESVMPCFLSCEGCCLNPEWTTKWFDPPSRDPEGLVLAIGPIDGRLVSARRELPRSEDPYGSRLQARFARSEQDLTLARFSFDSEPTIVEAQGRHVNGARVVELRVLERGSWRVVSRTIEK
jgi:hypothetical protein